jgi:hypothetical protein
MTATELLAELSIIQSRFEWWVTDQGRLRARLTTDPDNRVFDPVTAVAYVRTGKYFAEGFWTQAANSLGLEYEDCAEIVAACNYEWDISSRQGILRQGLLEALVRDNNDRVTDREPSSILEALVRSFRKRSATSPQ